MLDNIVYMHVYNKSLDFIKHMLQTRDITLKSTFYNTFFIFLKSTCDRTKLYVVLYIPTFQMAMAPGLYRSHVPYSPFPPPVLRGDPGSPFFVDIMICYSHREGQLSAPAAKG